MSYSSKNIKNYLFNSFTSLNNEIEKKIYFNYINERDDEIIIENVIKYDFLVNNVLDNMDKITKEVINFWDQIKNNKFYETINQNANKINRYMRDTHEIFNEIDNELNFRNYNFLSLYQKYLADVIYSEVKAGELKERLLQIQLDSIAQLKISKQEINTVINIIYNYLINHSILLKIWRL